MKGRITFSSLRMILEYYHDVVSLLAVDYVVKVNVLVHDLQVLQGFQQRHENPSMFRRVALSSVYTCFDYDLFMTSHDFNDLFFFFLIINLLHGACRQATAALCKR